MGKQAESIKHLQILVDQQSRLAPIERHADVHLHLGNMYMQVGELEKARAAWNTGAELFPDHSELQEQLALSEAD